jgi:hypothetical protein
MARICPRCGGPDLHYDTGTTLTAALARHGMYHLPSQSTPSCRDIHHAIGGEYEATMASADAWCLVHELDEEASVDTPETMEVDRG